MQKYVCVCILYLYSSCQISDPVDLNASSETSQSARRCQAAGALNEVLEITPGPGLE